MKRFELLAPAGNQTCLHAAVSAGADAVYLGVSQFNARRNADNFTLETLNEACDFAHLRGVSVYLTLNTIILPSELQDALELARQAYRSGVDAFIVQDPGLAREIARIIPQTRVHISTQMNVHNEDGLVAASALGAKRVTFARELSLEELYRLSAVAHDLGLEAECFAHGALCICYSGQCFMSSMIGARSANRGMCAQACRLPYELHNRALRKTLETPGEFLLSPKDLCTAEILPQLLASGVDSLKIEGRMKSPEYVAAVVSVYRGILDRIYAWEEQSLARGLCVNDFDWSEAPHATEKDMQMLSEAFSRGFTTAYLEGICDNSMMGYTRPNNRGVFVGRIARVKGDYIEIAATEELQAGDVIEFWTRHGNVIHRIDRLEKTDADKPIVYVEKPLNKGDRVFRVRKADAQFEDRAFEPRIPVDVSLDIHLGQPIKITLSTSNPFVKRNNPRSSQEAREISSSSTNSEVVSVTVEGAPVEAARTKALSKDEVIEHVNRMGSTPFRIASISVDMDEGVGMGFSLIHKVRADATSALEQALLAPFKSRELLSTKVRTMAPLLKKGGCKVGVIATNPACARAAKRAGADFIYVPVLNHRRGEALIAGQVSATAEQAGYPKQCIPILPVVVHDGPSEDSQSTSASDISLEADRFYKRLQPNKPVLVQNLGQLVRAQEQGAIAEIGPFLPITNALDLQLAYDWGASRVWLTPELTLTQIEELGTISPVALGATIIGNTQLMITEHCVLMSQGPCNQDCAHCARRKSPHYLTDRKGYEMPVVTDYTGRSHIYNAVELDVAHAVPELIGAGVSALMVDTTLMNVEQVRKKVARAVRARDIALKSGDRVSRAENTTTGHFFRGVS